jgi:hypothetical protein
LKQILEPLHPTWDFVDFDCFIEYIMPDMEAIKNLMSDPGFVESIKDQEDWVDTSKALVSIGYDTPYLLETGEVVNMAK